MSLGYSMGFAEGTDLPIEHCTYEYINQCKDGAELEKILKVLRSGKEGVYPDLIKTTEDCLKAVKPNSKLLIKAQNITKVTDLPNDEWKTVNSDLQQWEKIISREEDTLSNQKKDMQKDIVTSDSTDIPPVRKGGVVKEQPPSEEAKKKAKPSSTGAAPERIKSYDFKAWDKYDANREMNKVDQQNNTAENKKEQDSTEWNHELTEKEKGMSELERQRAGQREREKGNEAFRAGDYEEAMAYYTHSLKLYPDTAAFNNRALVYIKMNKYEQALADCREALKREPDNTKALLRCATACEALKDYHEAVEVCERLLRVEPNNKRCQELLNKVKQSYVPDTSRDTNRKPKGKRIAIEEVDEQIEQDTANILTTTPTNYQPSNADTFVCNTGDVSSTVGLATAGESTVAPPTKQQPVTTPTPPPPPPLPVNVQFLKDKGNELFRVGQYGTALNKYTEAIQELEKCDGDHTHSLSTLYSNRSACNLKIGDCRSCVNDSTKAISLSPVNIKALIRRAMAYETMEKYRLAFTDCQLVLRVDPKIDKIQDSISRLTKLLRDQDGGKWREKLKPCSEEDQVLAAFHFSVPDSQPVVATPLNTNAEATPPEPPTSNPQQTPNDIIVSSPTTQPIKPEPITTGITSTDSTTGNTDTTDPANTTGNTGTTGTTSAAGNTGTTSAAGSTGTKETGGASTYKKRRSNQEMFEDFKTQGNAFVKQGDYLSALHRYTSCIEACPGQVVGYTNRALCYLKREQFDKCEADCSYALGLEPKNVKALYRRALARKEMKKFQESLKDLKLVTELEPSNMLAKKEKDAVHDLYLKELRGIQQANKPSSNTSNKDTKASKKPMQTKASGNNGGTSKKTSNDKKNKKPPLSTEGKKHKSSSSTPPTTTPTSPSPVSPTTTTVTKETPEKAESLSPTPRTDDVEKKRKKVLIKEVVDDEDDTGTKNKAEDKGNRNEDEGKGAESEKDTSPKPKINLHEIKAEETNIGSLIQLWNSAPRSATPLHYAQLLLKIKPSLLEQVISNKLEGHTLTNIIAALDQHLVPEGFIEFTYNVLQVLSRVSRFSFIKMFLSRKEKEVLAGIFDKIREAGCCTDNGNLTELRGKYSL